MAPEGALVVAGWHVAVRSLGRNPLLWREVRGWRRRTRDWRLWIGLRLPREIREWGLPAIVWFSLAPYVIWASVGAIRRVAPELPTADNALVFEIVVVVLMLYACLVTAISTATAVVEERQQATWDSLLATPLSAHELTLGYLVGRAGPVMIGVLLAIGIWALAQPHYALLLAPLGGLMIAPAEFAVLGAAVALRLMAIGALGLAITARARHGGAATAAAVALVLALMAADLVSGEWLIRLGWADLRAPLFLTGNLLIAFVGLEMARRRIRRPG